MINSIKAFSPAHITGFFDPYFDRDARKSGSRGAGISLSLGVTTKVSAIPSNKQSIGVYINKKPVDAYTTKLAIKNLIGDTLSKIKVEIVQSLPLSQGFGLSGAGALSAALATARLFGLSRIDALEAAHNAEVIYRTGLGDVLAESFGGIEIRKSPGLPPWGEIEHIPGNSEVVVCVIGNKIPTSEILNNPEIVKRIRTNARYCLTSLLENPSLENLLIQSYRFARNVGLADDKIMKAIEMANNYGIASMCMLGNSIFAIGETEKLTKALSVFGKVFRCTIDQQGARIIEE